MKRYQIGIVGCGNISDVYIPNLHSRFENTKVYALCDKNIERAKEQADRYSVEKIMTLEDMIACDEIDAILIITLPDTHYILTKQCILGGKNVYVEKPISFSVEEGKELISLAKEKGVLLGGAPDTFLGASTSSAKKWIEEGKLGRIIAASGFLAFKGHEHWHPSPEYFYKKGAGPMLDFGPYYITTLVRLCGKANKVTGFTARTYDQRLITSEPLKGQIIDVEVETLISGAIQFENGVIANILCTYDFESPALPYIEIYGTKGNLKLPWPNKFSDTVCFCTFGGKMYEEIEIEEEYSIYQDNCRGLGLSQMLGTLDSEESVLASGEMATHVLDIMLAFEKSAKTGKAIIMK